MATPSAPRFLKPIPTRTTCIARSVGVLEVFLKGRPIPNITWHKNGVPIVIEDKYQMHFEDTGKCCLIINGVDEDDEGEYECRAKNCYGQVSCFGEMYIKNDATSTKFVDPCKQNRIPVSGQDECSVASEGKSGLFILIDEGSQDDENSADETGYKESISASEQIESIIEDLTMGDGSLNLSLGREGTFASELDAQEDLPLDENKYFKSKELEEFIQENYFEDSVDVDNGAHVKQRVHHNSKMHDHFPAGQQKLTLQLRKVAGVQDNLHQAFDSENEPNTIPAQEFESVRTADVRGWTFQPMLAVKPTLSSNDSYEIFHASDNRPVGNCERNDDEPLNSNEREEMGTLAVDSSAKLETAVTKHKKCSDSESVRCRRNTTDGVLPEMTSKEAKTQKRRISDRKESHGFMDGPEQHLYSHSLQQQQKTWNSFQTTLKDSLIVEDQDDPLCPDSEAGHDDVFIEQYREDPESALDSPNSLDHKTSEVKDE